MRDRMKKTIITLLVVTAMMIGIMPFASRKAEAATNQIVWDASVISSISLDGKDSRSFSSGGITVNAYAVPELVEGQDYSLCDFKNSTIRIGTGDISFSPSVGSITKIEIECDTVENFFKTELNIDWKLTGPNGYITLTCEKVPMIAHRLYDASHDAPLAVNHIKKITFTVTVVDYNIEVSADPTEGGSVSGGNTYEKDSEATVTATPYKGYAFVNWTENGNEVSTDSTYTFKVTGNRKLVANFDVAYNLWVGGRQVRSKYLSNKTEGWSYDPETLTLTLENANITNTYKRSCIYIDSLGGTLTIFLKGSNSIGNKVAVDGIFVIMTPTVITGDGSLTVTDVTEIGIADDGSGITIKDTTVKFENCQYGINGSDTLKIDNSTVTVSADYDGIFYETVIITDSKVDVTASRFGILSYDNKISISGNSYVSADTTDSGAKAAGYAMAATKGFELDGVEIIEPEEGDTKPKTIFEQERYAIVDKGDNIAPKAVIAKTYTITFQNDDETVLQKKNTPVYETPKYEGNTPTKKSDGTYTYTFKGWDKEITAVKGNETYTAVYDKSPIEKPESTPIRPYNIPKTGIE